MNSFQNLQLLRNLYRQRAVGYSFVDPVMINQRDDQVLPSQLGPLHTMVSQCHLCDLSKSRKQSMRGQGNPKAALMIVDAYVSKAEDDTGEYYVGRSGESLRKMVENVLELSEEEVYVTHAVKCKALGTHTPSISEWNSCKAYLFREIDIIKPDIIMALGPDAYRLLSLDRSTPFEQVRGRQIRFGATTLVPIHHPAFLLRNPALKQDTMQDLLQIKELLCVG